MVKTFGNDIINAYTGGVQVKEIYSFGVKVWPVSTPIPTPANNQIFYTSTDHNTVVPYRDGRGPFDNDYTAGFGARIVSNTYTNYGIIGFDNDVTKVYFGFTNKSTLETIKLPSGVDTIGQCAFQFCDNLVSVDMQEGVETIGQSAFYGCSKLQSITIPSTVTSIGWMPFTNSTLLSEVIVKAVVPPTMYTPGSAQDYPFYGCSANLVIKVPASSVTAYQNAPVWSDYASQIVGYYDDTIDFSTLGLETSTAYANVPFTSGDLTVEFTGLPNYPVKYYSSDMTMRVYNSGVINISSTRTIREIVFTWSGATTFRPDADYATPTGYDTTTEKWTGSSSSVVMTRPSVTGHWKLKVVEVVYDS